MLVALRTDASGRIGTGHARRCLSLAEALRRESVETLFVSRRHDALSSVLEQEGQPLAWLPPADPAFTPAASDPPHASWADASWEQDAHQTIAALQDLAPEWVLVDHYAFDARWHRLVARALSCRIAAIDDLADRPLAAALVVDHNLHPEPAAKYAGRLEPGARLLAGPRFALLASKYATAPRYRFRRHVRSLGIFLSGADVNDATSATLLACRNTTGFDGEIELVSSSRSPHLTRHQELARRWPRTRVLVDLPDLCGFFGRHDLQIGSGGSAAWERCCLGAPTLAIQLAANQRAVLPHLAALGAIEWLEQATPVAIGAAVRHMIEQPQRRLALARGSRGLVDGLGSARVAAVLALSCNSRMLFRPAAMADEALLLDWANDPQARTHAFHPGRIEPQKHHAWFAARLATPEDCRMLVATSPAGLPLGVVRFERDGSLWTISYSLDAAFRGWGHGERLLSGAVAVLRAQVGSAPVEGWVRSENGRSLRIFRSLGFEESRIDRDGMLCHRFRN